MFFFHTRSFFKIYIFYIIIISRFWWSNIIREATLLGFHTKIVQKNIIIRIIWFIRSEVFFFLGFFWAFFHSSLSPSVSLSSLWPPIRVLVLNPIRVPILNTIVLLSSGFTVTWSHYSLLYYNLEEARRRLISTIFLRVFFTFLQYIEYIDCSFTISDSVYRSCFFMATGFHGFHVFVRTVILLVSLLRLNKRHFTSNQHVRFECSIWYWHFVDVVWILLYVSIYWWRSI